MPYKRTITSILPDPSLYHYHQTPEADEVNRLMSQLSRDLKDKIISFEKFKDSTTVRITTVYNTKEDFDFIERTIYEAFPNYTKERDEYNSFLGITYETVGEEV